MNHVVLFLIMQIFYWFIFILIRLDYLKPELIIRESQPIELPADVIRGIKIFFVLLFDGWLLLILFSLASETSNSYAMDELSNLDLKSRFTLFERAAHSHDDVEIREDHKTVKRSESILSRLARYSSSIHFNGLSDSVFNYGSCPGLIEIMPTWKANCQNPVVIWTFKIRLLKEKTDILTTIWPAVACLIWGRIIPLALAPYLISSRNGKMIRTDLRAIDAKSWQNNGRKNLSYYVLDNARYDGAWLSKWL